MLEGYLINIVLLTKNSKILKLHLTFPPILRKKNKKKLMLLTTFCTYQQVIVN